MSLAAYEKLGLAFAASLSEEEKVYFIQAGAFL